MAAPRFRSFDAIRTCLTDLPAPDSEALAAARKRNASLTKPPGALGQLEDLAIWYAGWRRDPRPSIMRPQIVVFAGNHGVAAQGVSAFPAEVTAQMVANFQAGGAAVNQLAHFAGAAFSVHPIALDQPTADFTQAVAMDEAAFLSAFNLGMDAVGRNCDLLVVGEMGIGNTTSAAALFAANFGGSGQDWVGRGTGVDDDGLARKADAVTRGLAANPDATSGIEALRCLGESRPRSWLRLSRRSVPSQGDAPARSPSGMAGGRRRRRRAKSRAVLTTMR